MTVATTVGIKWPDPLPSKRDPRAARAQVLKKPTLEGCDYRPVVSKPTQREQAPQVPSIQRGLLISNSWASPTASPRVSQMQKVGGSRLPPRSGHTDQGFEA
jgi:hypothetical protein